MREESEDRRPQAREIGRGEGWCVNEVTCRLGPADRPFEECHDRMSIAAVLSGSFQYRSENGRAMLYPGAFLLGNAGACFTCGHEHGVGDRCIAFHLDRELFSEVAASVTGSGRFHFPAPILPAPSGLLSVVAEVEAVTEGGMFLEEQAIRIVESVLARFSERRAPAVEPGARDRRRMSDALRHMEKNFDRPLGLAELASIARMSRYHFLRTFRRVLGVTPYRLLLDMRLRRAALALATTGEPVAAIAYAAGFGDLSTFNARFRKVFGVSPRAFRCARRAQTFAVHEASSQRPRRSRVRARTFASS